MEGFQGTCAGRIQDIVQISRQSEIAGRFLSFAHNYSYSDDYAMTWIVTAIEPSRGTYRRATSDQRRSDLVGLLSPIKPFRPTVYIDMRML